MEHNDCLFCQLPATRIVYQNKVFTLSLCLGPIVIGHVLIISKIHTSSFSNTILENQMVFREFRDQVKNYYTSLFGDCLLFEHGNHSPNKFSIHSHAHLHIIPLPTKSNISYLLKQYNASVRYSDYSTETTAWIHDREYLYYESLVDEPRFYIFPDWPQKYFARHLVTIASEEPGLFVDWETDPREDVMLQTAKILRSFKRGFHGKA